MPEFLDVVDKNNKVIGKERRDIIHSNGLFHRGVNIFVFNSKGLVFLQKRSANKDICPSKWDLSAAETLKVGEKHKQAAVRCLKEELGINAKISRIRNVNLQKMNILAGR